MRRVLGLAVVSVLACTSSTALHAQGESAIYVVSYLEAVPASQRQVASLLEELARASRTEGPVRYETLQSTTQSNQFAILEIWKDQAAREAHAGAEHTRRFREQVGPLLLAPIDDRICVATMVGPTREGRGTIYAVTHIDVPGNSRDAAMALMRPFAEQTRRDPGALRFDVVHQSNRTNHFTSIGVWADQKSADEGQRAVQTRTFRTGLTPLLGALYDQRWYRPLSVN
ncbi:MAG: antibiotic biosynthesis monooxygenase [Acidobacteria bacterium]|nr:antibiotic biosynthesis monooxygenase [Acidobacteriota bacterium]